VLLGGPPQNAVISSTAPTNPPNGLVWVEPINPIVDLFSPDTMTDASLWQWAGFGYGFPGLLISEVPEGIQADWNPAPGQAPGAGQLACAPLLAQPFVGHQMLAQMTVRVPTGSPDVRLTHAFTSSSAWVTEKDEDVTVAMNFIWTGGPLLFGPESTPAPAGGGVLVKSIHLYDLTSSPPSPMRVWDEAVQLWLPINDGLVQRAGDRMVGDLRFDTIDAASGQPTVTGLPTPVDATDAVPLGFLEAVISSLPDPGTGGGSLVVVDDIAPDSPATGLQWLDTARPDVAPFTVAVKGSSTVANAPVAGTWADAATWPTWAVNLPCNGLLVIDSTIQMRCTVASTVIAARVDMKQATDCQVIELTSQSLGIARLSDDTALDGYTTSEATQSVFVIQGIPDDGTGQIELGWSLWTSGAINTGQFVNGFSVCQFIPYGEQRIQILDLDAGSVTHFPGGTP
jgi:hypothetical protein